MDIIKVCLKLIGLVFKLIFLVIIRDFCIICFQIYDVFCKIFQMKRV